MKRKIYLIVTILIIFNIFLFLSPTNKYISNIYVNLNQYVKDSSKKFNDIFSGFESQKILEQKVEELKLKNMTLEKENKELKKENDILTDENSSLKNSLELTKENNKLLIANVMYKKINTPLNIYVIDKGKNDGIKINQLVTYEGQMIGYINRVEDDTSEVTLLKNDGLKFNIPIKIKTPDKDVDGVIESYSYSNNKIVVTTLLEEGEILEGDKVYSNGYVENQANNVYVGDIVEVNSDNLKKEYYVEPVIGNIEYVEVNINED